jgi:hypothetical protein
VTSSYQRERYRRRREAGLCTKCARPATKWLCGVCAEKDRAWHPPRRSEQERERARWASLKHCYGISRREWEALFVAQGKRCGICGRADYGAAKGWHTDHDHETGRVRGILCGACNRGLGQFGDSPDVLAAARKYLRRFKVRAPRTERSPLPQLTLIRGAAPDAAQAKAEPVERALESA